jgi:Sodium/hydrogen exchanger family
MMKTWTRWRLVVLATIQLLFVASWSTVTSFTATQPVSLHQQPGTSWRDSSTVYGPRFLPLQQGVGSKSAGSVTVQMKPDSSTTAAVPNESHSRWTKWRRRLSHQSRSLWHLIRKRPSRIVATAATLLLLWIGPTAMSRCQDTAAPSTPVAVERVVARRGGSSAIQKKQPNPSILHVPCEVEKFEKAVERGMMRAEMETSKTLTGALQDLHNYMRGPKSDTLLLLLATALITPACKKVGTSPILGFLASGMLLGPNALGLISGIHTTETLAELGIVFFLFEMGIELSFERLLSMKKDVLGLRQLGAHSSDKS